MQSSFDSEPKGDKTRVRRAGILLVKTLLNSMYTLNWLNTLKIADAKPDLTLRQQYDSGVNAFNKWTKTLKYQSCRLCQSCGGNYPNYGGHGFTEGDWGTWL